VTVEHDQTRITVLAIAPQDAVIDRLRAFEIACGRKSGLRLVREDGVVAVSIDPSRIERLGPVVEAAAVIAGVRLLLRHPLGDVDVPLGGELNSRPSGLWAAIGDAIDEDAIERSRRAASDGDPFRHVRVDMVQGVATAADARPPRVEPIGGPADDLGSEKFDDVDYHQGAAEAAGQPIEQAFTHIGLFLAWAIRHDLHDPAFFPADHVGRIKAGAWTGSDIADDVDGKLVSDVFTAEGAEFASAQYGEYLEAYGNTFADMPDYGVTDDASSASRIEPILDELYRAWIAAGKPPPEPSAVTDLEATEPSRIPDIPWDEIPAGRSVAMSSDGSWELVEETRPHEAPEVEKLVPADLLGETLDLMSSWASHWGSSLLNRALRDLHVRPKDASVATALGGSGERTLAISIYRVPGIDADRLFERFGSVIVRPGRGRWHDRAVDGRRVSWADGEWAPGVGGVAVAYWTRDGYVFHAAGRPEDVELAVRRVGESLDA
jgi:hypothetical protein